jgi:1-acyl-sn-glycerol-3-phosphate acyltransferase
MDLYFSPVAGMLKTWIKVMGWEMLVTGEEHIPADGPAVLASNHISYLDPVTVGYAADMRGRPVRYLAKQELFDKPVFGGLLRKLKQVPVDRHGAPGKSLEIAAETLRSGELVVNFPEATISTSFVPSEGKTGAARMAMRAGVPLIPVANWGGQRILTKGRPRNLQRGVVLAVRVGAPLPYEPDEDPTVVTKRLMDRLTELVDQAASTYPQQPSGPDDRWWLPQHMGGTAPTVEEAAQALRAERERKRAERRSRAEER